jgi:hypothetical protein
MIPGWQVNEPALTLQGQSPFATANDPMTRARKIPIFLKIIVLPSDKVKLVK